MYIFALFLLSGILNLYLGTQHIRLLRDGIIRTERKISLEIINAAIKSEKDSDNLKKLRQVKRIYVFNLILFCVVFALAVYSIYVSAISTSAAGTH